MLSDSLTTVEYISWVYKLSIFRTCENVGLQSAREVYERDVAAIFSFFIFLFFLVPTRM